MRSICTIFISLLFATVANAQTDYCATSESDLSQLRNQVAHAKQQAHFHKRSLQDTTYYIPFKAHIVGRDDGSGYYEVSTLYEVMCNLNKQMAQANMYFYLKGEVNYIPNTTYYRHDFSEGISMMNQHNVSDAVNVYFVDDPNGACGYFTYQGNAVAMNKSCSGISNSTLAHELGHFFGLPHTFNGWEGNDIRDGETIPTNQQELVNGSNCSNSNVGDGFCDTPPDYFSFRWSCPESFQPTDPNGDTINPDETLFMSYASDGCQDRFSQEQKSYMLNNSLLSQRQNLLNGSKPVTDSVGATQILSPTQNAKNVPAKNTILKWEAATNATHYYVETFGNVNKNVETITTDTFIVTDLDPNQTYYWRVKPLNPGYTCSPKSGVKNFTTSDTCVTATVDSNENEFVVKANGGTKPYSYSWSTGDTDRVFKPTENGTYTVTVSDSQNCAVAKQVTYQKPTGGVDNIASQNQNTIELHPNPVRTGNTIRLQHHGELKGNANLSLYSVQGKLIRQYQPNFDQQGQLSLSTTNLQEGVYLLRIDSEALHTTEKLILY